MRVAIAHVPIWTTQSPPLAPAYLAGYLRPRGFDCTIYDLNAELFHRVPEADRALWGRAWLHGWHVDEVFQREIRPKTFEPFADEYIDRMLAGGTRVIGISVNSPCYAITLAQRIRERAPGVVIIGGGQCCEPDWFGNWLMRTGAFDAIVVGEGEVTFETLLTAVRDTGHLPEACPGALTHGAGERAGEVVNGGYPVLVEDLDSLPFPEYPGIDFQNYWWEGKRAPADALIFSVLSSRGCVRHCDFCIQQSIWGGKHRLRSAINVVDEIELRVKQGAHYIFFNDLLVNGNPKLLREMCELIIERGIKVGLSGSFIVNRRMTTDYVDIVNRAGFSHFDIGVEHISPTVLHAMGKYYEEDLVRQCIENLKRANQDWSSSWIIGYPSERSDDFTHVILFLLENRPLIPRAPSVSLCAVLPGSDLWRKRESLNIALNNNDAMGWWLADFTNTLAIRTERGALIQLAMNLLWDRVLPLTGSNADQRMGQYRRDDDMDFANALDRIDIRVGELRAKLAALPLPAPSPVVEEALLPSPAPVNVDAPPVASSPEPVARLFNMVGQARRLGETLRTEGVRASVFGLVETLRLANERAGVGENRASGSTTVGERPDPRHSLSAGLNLRNGGSAQTTAHEGVPLDELPPMPDPASLTRVELEIMLAENLEVRRLFVEAQARRALPGIEARRELEVAGPQKGLNSDT
jgi:radical SAM superfamily enzyme YgiQ (UPF0313 family)